MERKAKVQNAKIFSIVLSFIFCFLPFISGCALINEKARQAAGVSTRALEKARARAAVKTFGVDYFTCYTHTMDILKRIDAYIYAQDIKKHMIAIYVSKEDTTAVGLFFKEIETNKTRIEFASLSTYAKELIAGRVSALWEESGGAQAEAGGETDVQK